MFGTNTAEAVMPPGPRLNSEKIFEMSVSMAETSEGRPIRRLRSAVPASESIPSSRWRLLHCYRSSLYGGRGAAGYDSRVNGMGRD